MVSKLFFLSFGWPVSAVTVDRAKKKAKVDEQQNERSPGDSKPFGDLVAHLKSSEDAHVVAGSPSGKFAFERGADGGMKDASTPFYTVLGSQGENSEQIQPFFQNSEQSGILGAGYTGVSPSIPKLFGDQIFSANDDNEDLSVAGYFGHWSNPDTSESSQRPHHNDETYPKSPLDTILQDHAKQNQSTFGVQYLSSTI